MRSKQLLIISKRPRKSDFTFFLDRQTESDDLAKVLRDARIQVKRHCERFTPEEDDDAWIRSVAQEGWVAISADQRIEADHLDVVCRSRAKVVLLTDNNSGYPQWAASLIAFNDRIVEKLLSSDGPMIIRLSKNSITKVRFPEEVETKRRNIETQKIIRTKKMP